MPRRIKGFTPPYTYGMPDFRDGIAAWNAAWELSFPFFDSKVRNLETLVESNASGEQEKMHWNYNLVRSVPVIQVELRVLAVTSVLEPNSCWKTLTPAVREAHMLEGLFRTCLREPAHMPNTRMYTSDITLASMETDNGEGFLTLLKKYDPDEASVMAGGSTSYLHPGWTKESIERLENAGHAAGVQIWIALRDSFLERHCSTEAPSIEVFLTQMGPARDGYTRSQALLRQMQFLETVPFCSYVFFSPTGPRRIKSPVFITHLVFRLAVQTAMATGDERCIAAVLGTVPEFQDAPTLCKVKSLHISD
ncbi:hypothetical protein B0H13DRAFT_2666476 [Mycena leptocephala]|nr:hypothetical protein B0H13DRAFT_2666476 [Mycena leptocephala]